MNLADHFKNDEQQEKEDRTEELRTLGERARNILQKMPRWLSIYCSAYVDDRIFERKVMDD